MKISRHRAQRRELCRQILQAINDQMSHAVLLLQQARSDQCPGLTADSAISLPDMRPANQIGGAGFIFERDEGGSLGGSRALSHENDACYPVTLVGLQVSKRSGWHDLL